jgi:hypothetical protein
MSTKKTYDDLKKVNIQKYLLVLALTVIIFGAGILVGNWIASNKISSLEGMGQDLRTDIIALELQQDLIEADPCESAGILPLSEQLYTLGTRLDFMEGLLGKNNKDVIQLKHYYSLLELRHWLFMSKLNKQCNQSNVLILYFYSNLDDCPRCEEQGYVLSYMHDKYPNLMVYSFDINMENIALSTVKSRFGLTISPSLVVNDVVFEGFQSRNKLEESIKEIVGNFEESIAEPITITEP